MSWIIIPKSSVEGLASSKSTRGALSKELLEPRVQHTHSVITDEGGILSLQHLGEGLGSRLIMAAVPAGRARGAGTRAAYDLERSRCVHNHERPGRRVAIYIGAGLSSWSPSLGQCSSIRSMEAEKGSGFPLGVSYPQISIDLRVAYELRTIASINTLAIGTVYFAYRQEKKIDVPQIDNELIANLPDTVTKPIADIHGPANGHQASSDEYDPDVLINRGRGEDRHLFSMTRSEWMDKESPLTRQQRRVINDKKCPLRIHGPGGSGKTLVLILKALSLLADAAERDEVCNVLLVLHNNEVRTNVRAAIESIDEGGFLATTKADRQFLDVETLHGWCMRELKIDTGGIDYALHPDVIISKRKQDELLVKVVEETLTTRLENNKPLMS